MKHMEEMKIAGLAMALCIVMLGIYIVVPKDGTVSHLTAIPDNNAAEPVTDSTSEGTADADFPIYTEDSYSSEPESSDDTGDGDSYTEEPTYDPGDNSYDGNTDSEANGVDTSDTSGGTGEDAGNYEDPDSGSGEVVDDNDYSGTSDTDLDSSEPEDTGSDGTSKKLTRIVKKEIKKTNLTKLKFTNRFAFFIFWFVILSVDVLEQGCHFLIKNIL